MEVKETLNRGLERAGELVLPAKELDRLVSDKLAGMRSSIEMRGFRKGKVPVPVLKQRFGAHVMGDVVQESIEGALKRHIEKSGDRPAATPSVNIAEGSVGGGTDLRIEISYEALPEIPDLDAKSIKLERLVPRIEEAEIDERLGELAKNARNFKDRGEGSKAEDGDQVVIDVEGRVDGEKFPGGDAEDFAIVLGEDMFLPGFDAAFVGARAGDEVEAKATLPDELRDERLAGKEAVFSCVVKAVRAPAEVEIDDEFAKRLGAGDLGDLREKVRSELAGASARAARMVMKGKLFDILSEKMTFDLPPSMVAAETVGVARELARDEGAGGGAGDGEEGAEPGATGEAAEDPSGERADGPAGDASEEAAAIARRRLRLGLVLRDVAGKNGISVSQAEVGRIYFANAARGVFPPSPEGPAPGSALYQSIEAQLFEDKVCDFVFELVDVTDREVSRKEIDDAVATIG